MDLEPIRMQMITEDRELERIEKIAGPRLEFKVTIPPNNNNSSSNQSNYRVLCKTGLEFSTKPLLQVNHPFHPQSINVDRVERKRASASSSRKIKSASTNSLSHHTRLTDYDICSMTTKNKQYDKSGIGRSLEQVNGANRVSIKSNSSSIDVQHKSYGRRSMLSSTANELDELAEQGKSEEIELALNDNTEQDLWDTKSITYMLDIWQQAEGINMEPIITKIREKPSQIISQLDKIAEEQDKEDSVGRSESDTSEIRQRQSIKNTTLSEVSKKVKNAMRVFRRSNSLIYSSIEDLCSEFDPRLYAGGDMDNNEDNLTLSIHERTHAQIKKQVPPIESDNINHERLLRTCITTPHKVKETAKENIERREKERKLIAARKIIDCCVEKNQNSSDLDEIESDSNNHIVQIAQRIVKLDQNHDEQIKSADLNALSSDTFTYLKKLSREINDNDPDTRNRLLHQGESDRVRTTILGEQAYAIPLLDLFRSETLTGNEIFLKEKVEKPKFLKEMSRPGTMTLVINSLLADNDGKPVDFDKIGGKLVTCNRNSDFKLNLPDSTHQLDAEGMEFRPPSVVSSGAALDCLGINTSRREEQELENIGPKQPREATMFVIESLKRIFGKDLIVASSFKTPPTSTLLFKPIKLESLVPDIASTVEKQLFNDNDEFSLRRFAALIKSNILKLPQDDAMVGFGEAQSEWSKFMESSTARMTRRSQMANGEGERLYGVLCRLQIYFNL